jgi:hypothetical protein
LHALVIGVSEYKGLPEPTRFPPRGLPTLGLTQVKTPATSAWKFAQWLKTRYNNPKAPLKTIRLLLSTSREELAAGIPGLAEVSTTDRRAIRENAEEALTEWKKASTGNPANMTVLYASGHGMQWGSNNEAYVLLEDFCGKEQFLNYALNVGAIQQGMVGDEMPSVQLYFVDACRIRPEEAGNWTEVGGGLGLRIKLTGEGTGCAPIFFAAASGIAAQGIPGEGTFYCKALIECLDGLGVSGPDANSPRELEHYYHVRVGGIHDYLHDRIIELARDKSEVQIPAQGGVYNPAVFQVFNERPKASLHLDVRPPDLAAATQAELYETVDDEEQRRFGPDACYNGNPLVWPSVPMGYYRLQLNRPNPAKGPVRYVLVRPPRSTQLFELK